MQATQANNLLVEGRTVEGAIMSQAFSLQGFVLTGDRRRLAAFESGVPRDPGPPPPPPGFEALGEGAQALDPQLAEPGDAGEGQLGFLARELCRPANRASCAIR